MQRDGADPDSQNERTIRRCLRAWGWDGRDNHGSFRSGEHIMAILPIFAVNDTPKHIAVYAKMNVQSAAPS